MMQFYFEILPVYLDRLESQSKYNDNDFQSFL